MKGKPGLRVRNLGFDPEFSALSQCELGGKNHLTSLSLNLIKMLQVNYLTDIIGRLSEVLYVKVLCKL